MKGKVGAGSRACCVGEMYWLRKPVCRDEGIFRARLCKVAASSHKLSRVRTWTHLDPAARSLGCCA
eukprot:6203846-Pleurochrysis_carterae.AAC.2